MQTENQHLTATLLVIVHGSAVASDAPLVAPQGRLGLDQRRTERLEMREARGGRRRRRAGGQRRRRISRTARMVMLERIVTLGRATRRDVGIAATDVVAQLPLASETFGRRGRLLRLAQVSEWRRRRGVIGSAGRSRRRRCVVRNGCRVRIDSGGWVQGGRHHHRRMTL